MHISFAIIPLSILLFYGIEDKNADFFTKATYPDDYRAAYEGTVYPMGIMVSEWALIAILSIVGILVSWIGHEIFKIVIGSIAQPRMTI
jgi:hypothetical protein